jgi:hypothetical protein
VRELGKILIVVGLVITMAGLALVLGARVPGLGRLPGDIYVERERWSFYFPLATSLLLSALLTLLFFLIGRR